MQSKQQSVVRSAASRPKRRDRVTRMDLPTWKKKNLSTFGMASCCYFGFREGNFKNKKKFRLYYSTFDTWLLLLSEHRVFKLPPSSIRCHDIFEPSRDHANRWWRSWGLDCILAKKSRNATALDSNLGEKPFRGQKLLVNFCSLLQTSKLILLFGESRREKSRFSSGNASRLGTN